ncbi:MAG: succinate dehydrogenase/fumarate reductase iron-sulfur subunit [Dehalococcoidia bacterium]
MSLNLLLKVWRQSGPNDEGRFETYTPNDINEDMSFLEMLDVVNEDLISQGKEPIAFDHDCREGICGSCGVVINGIPHGPKKMTTTCQLHMRNFKTGDTITVEPWRSTSFPVIKDLVVDRSAFDAIIQAGGYISAPTGAARDGNEILIDKPTADLAFEAAACIGCGACVAACPNGAGQLFTAAKLAHLNLLPQGQPERWSRTVAMVDTMEEYFGSCTNYAECEAACPKGISIDFIAKMNRDYLKAKFRDRRKTHKVDTSEAGG